MYSTPTPFHLLLHAVLPAVVLAQGFAENSIPEPTQFSAIVSDSGVAVSVVGSPILIESDDTVAEIAKIDVVTSRGDRQRGFRVLLQSAGQVENLYMDPDQVTQLRDELSGLDTWYEKGNTCEAMRQCIHGVARCRPSQNIQQAFCPGFYSTPEGEKGVIVSTSRYSFRFPFVGPSVFVRTLDTATGE